MLAAITATAARWRWRHPRKTRPRRCWPHPGRGASPVVFDRADVGQIGANAVWTAATSWWSRPTRATARSSPRAALAVVTNIEADHLDTTARSRRSRPPSRPGRPARSLGCRRRRPERGPGGRAPRAISVGVDSSATYVMEDVELDAAPSPSTWSGRAAARPLSVPVRAPQRRNAAVAAVAPPGRRTVRGAARPRRFAGVPGASSSGRAQRCHLRRRLATAERGACRAGGRERGRLEEGCGRLPATPLHAHCALATRSPAPSRRRRGGRHDVYSAGEPLSRRLGRIVVEAVRRRARARSLRRRAATWWRSSPASCVTATCA